MVCIFYWLFVFMDDWNKRINIQPSHGLKLLTFGISLIQHLFYCIWMWTTVATHRTDLSLRNMKFVLVYVVVYTGQNYYCTKYGSGPVYPIMDWKGVSTIILLSLAYGIAFVGFFLAAYLSQAIKQICSPPPRSS